MPTESSAERATTEDTTDPAAVRRHIRERAEAVRRDELDRALSRLEATGETSEAQRDVLRELAHAVTDAVLATPEAALEDERVDTQTLEAALELFGEEP
jgi:glutamyl-tRNA reductase